MLILLKAVLIIKAATCLVCIAVFWESLTFLLKICSSHNGLPPYFAVPIHLEHALKRNTSLSHWNTILFIMSNSFILMVQRPNRLITKDLKEYTSYSFQGR